MFIRYDKVHQQRLATVKAANFLRGRIQICIRLIVQLLSINISSTFGTLCFILCPVHLENNKQETETAIQSKLKRKKRKPIICEQRRFAMRCGIQMWLFICSNAIKYIRRWVNFFKTDTDRIQDSRTKYEELKNTKKRVLSK